MELLRKLTSAFGPSGYEDCTAEIIMNEIKDYVDEIKKDRLGNVIALKKGNGKSKLMLAAHMDQIGVLVLDIDENGFLRFTGVGTYEPRTILYHKIVFANGAAGMVGIENGKETERLKFEDLYIDIGASNRENAVKKVGIGSFGVIESDFIVNGDRIFSGALDNRIGCYALIKVIKNVKRVLADTYFVFTVQEESYMSGATISAYSIEPDAAIIVDATEAGDTPIGIRSAVKLGGGTAVTIMDGGLISHPWVKNLLISTAEKYSIRYQFDVAVAGATDGAEVHVSRSGVMTGALSIPLRYMHTPCESIDMNDVKSTIELLLKIVEKGNNS